MARAQALPTCVNALVKQWRERDERLLRENGGDDLAATMTRSLAAARLGRADELAAFLAASPMLAMKPRWLNALAVLRDLTANDDEMTSEHAALVEMLADVACARLLA